jgi:hypothetical protein
MSNFDFLENILGTTCERITEKARLLKIDQDLEMLYAQIGRAHFNNFDDKEAISKIENAIEELLQEKEEILKNESTEEKIFSEEVQFCPNCGAKCELSDTFCFACGSKLRKSR